MSEEFFRSASGADSPPGERVLWSGHCAVAEYAFEEPASLPRWTLPEGTEVVVTEDRVLYRDTATGATGALSWPWPQHLRVQPGSRDRGRAKTVTQIQLVCAGPDGTFPALVFAGGDLATVRDADRLANVLRQAIARYRVEHAIELGIPPIQARMLSRLVIGPEFSNHQGGEGQTVSLLGATTVRKRPAEGSIYGRASEDSDLTMPLSSSYVSSRPISVVSVSSAPVSGIPASSAPATGVSVPAARVPSGVPFRPAAQPDLESRAADLAARVASLVSAEDGPDRPFDTGATNLSTLLDPRPNQPVDPADRAEQMRRTAARLASNSARARSTLPRRGDSDLGANSSGSRGR